MFKPIPGYEDQYSVSDLGEVFSLLRDLILKPAINPQTGYAHVSLWKEGKGRSFSVHRLVAKAFIPNLLNKPEVNHLNAIRHHNHSENLEWVTSSENSYHAISIGTRIYTNRLTEDEFLQCVWDVINGESYQTLCKRVPYKVSYLSTKVRKTASNHDLEILLDESLMKQRIKRAKINGAKNH